MESSRQRLQGELSQASIEVVHVDLLMVAKTPGGLIKVCLLSRGPAKEWKIAIIFKMTLEFKDRVVLITINMYDEHVNIGREMAAAIVRQPTAARHVCTIPRQPGRWLAGTDRV